MGGEGHAIARASDYASLFLRLALAASFLSAVCDRFGLWGPPGAPGVAWGTFSVFESYTGRLNWFLPWSVVVVQAWIVTALETTLALLLIVGLATRWVALAAGILLLLFALAMTGATGIKGPLDYSVFSASAGAFLLATLREYPWSIDHLRTRTPNPEP